MNEFEIENKQVQEQPKKKRKSLIDKVTGMPFTEEEVKIWKALQKEEKQRQNEEYKKERQENAKRKAILYSTDINLAMLDQNMPIAVDDLYVYIDKNDSERRDFGGFPIKDYKDPSRMDRLSNDISQYASRRLSILSKDYNPDRDYPGVAIVLEDGETAERVEGINETSNANFYSKPEYNYERSMWLAGDMQWHPLNEDYYSHGKFKPTAEQRDILGKVQHKGTLTMEQVIELGKMVRDVANLNIHDVENAVMGEYEQLFQMNEARKNYSALMADDLPARQKLFGKLHSTLLDTLTLRTEREQAQAEQLQEKPEIGEN